MPDHPANTLTKKNEKLQKSVLRNFFHRAWSFEEPSFTIEKKS